MDQVAFLKNVMDWMLDYQRENNIERECSVNALLFYDAVRTACPEADAQLKAVMVTYDTPAGRAICPAHCVVTVFDDMVLDPSYDIAKHSKHRYYFTLAQAKRAHLLHNVPVDDIKQFLRFAARYARGQEAISSMRVYNDQADYINERCEEKYGKPIFSARK